MEINKNVLEELGAALVAAQESTHTQLMTMPTPVFRKVRNLLDTAIAQKNQPLFSLSPREDGSIKCAHLPPGAMSGDSAIYLYGSHRNNFNKDELINVLNENAARIYHF